MSKEVNGLPLAWRLGVACVALGLLAGGAGAAAGQNGPCLVLVGLEDAATWRDMAYLAAVPAASHQAAKRPAVVAVDPKDPISRELADYIERYSPTQIFALALDKEAKAPDGLRLTPLSAASAADSAAVLAKRFWKTCPRAVLCREDDYASALLAAGLAGRWDCPLVYCGAKGTEGKTTSLLTGLGVRTVLAVGDVPAAAIGSGRTVARVKTVLDAAAWLKNSGLKCDYLAVANPYDRAHTLKPRLSLIAPLLAAARDGLVVPLTWESHWRKVWETQEPKGDRPAGLAESRDPIRCGKAELGGKDVAFAMVHVPGGRGKAAGKRGPTLWRVYLDVNGDKKFTAAGEGPFWSGDSVCVGASEYTLIAAGPDRRRRKRPPTLETCTPTAEQVHRHLKAIHKALGRAPRHLCLIGHPDAVPFWTVLDGPQAETFVESDVPYADIDSDPFYELLVGRIIAENARFATLHASRIITYESLLNPRWQDSVGFARWEDSLGPQFANVGFFTQYQHTKYDRAEVKSDKPLAPGARRGRIKYEGSFRGYSPMTNVSALVHGAHSWFMGLGETFTVEATALLSPCVVESAGCGPTALHIDRKFISVVSRLFRNGAVAFHGNAVPAAAPHQELRYAFWMSVLGGESLGEAHRDCLNRKMLTVLAGGQLERGGIDRRSQIARHLYGDPAMRMHIPDSRRYAPARTEVKADRLTLLGPERWYIEQIRVPEDWKRWRQKPLYVLRAPGIYIRAQWCREEYDREEIYTDVAYTTTRKLTSIRQETKLPAPLGWNGKYYVDVNADGTRTYRWRVRMADFDQIHGLIRAKAERIEYRLK